MLFPTDTTAPNMAAPFKNLPVFPSSLNASFHCPGCKSFNPFTYSVLNELHPLSLIAVGNPFYSNPVGTFENLEIPVIYKFLFLLFLLVHS